MTYEVIFLLTDIRVERLYVHVLYYGTVWVRFVKSKSCASTPVQCITRIHCNGQRETIHMTSYLYVCFINRIPLAFPHVTTGLYTFDPYFRFAIEVIHGFVEHCVKGLLFVTHGASMVHTTKECTDPFIMPRLLIDVCTTLDILRVHLTARPRVLVLDTDDLFVVRNPPHRLV